MALRKVRFPIAGSNNRFIECRLIYRLGGMNMFTYNTEPRGYWLSASPVVVERGFASELVSECPMDGLRMLLKEVSRASKKAEAEASAAMDTVMRDLVRKVCAKNGISIDSVSIEKGVAV